MLVFAKVGEPYTVQSVWLSIGYLLLALEERGLASLTYTPSNAETIRKALGVPDDYRLQAVIPVGRPRKEKRKEPRLPVSEVAFSEKWGRPLRAGSP